MFVLEKLLCAYQQKAVDKFRRGCRSPFVIQPLLLPTRLALKDILVQISPFQFHGIRHYTWNVTVTKSSHKTWKYNKQFFSGFRTEKDANDREPY
jgi:hypothetical protein